MASLRKSLTNRIFERCGSVQAFEKALGLEEGELNCILSGELRLSFEQMEKAGEILSIPSEEIGYFFLIDQTELELYNELEKGEAIEINSTLGRFEDKDEQINCLLSALSHELSDYTDPQIMTSYDFDSRLVSKCISDWYNITRTFARILLDQKKDHKLDKDQLRQFNKALDKFGWTKAKSKEELHQEKLDSNSPYIGLSEQFFIKNMVIQRGLASGKRSTREYYLEQKEYIESLTEEEKIRWLKAKRKEFELLGLVMDEAIYLPAEERTYIDESSDVSKLYQSTPEDRARAMTDINEVKALNERKQMLYSMYIDSKEPLDKHREIITKELIEEAIALGYTAGINANTTEVLRRAKGISTDYNTSDNSNSGKTNTN